MFPNRPGFLSYILWIPQPFIAFVKIGKKMAVLYGYRFCFLIFCSDLLSFFITLIMKYVAYFFSTYLLLDIILTYSNTT